MTKIYTINKVKTYPNHDIKQVQIDNKIYYVCNVCGRLMSKKISANKKVWCNKHYKQLKKYGKPIDINPRTILDKNEINVVGDIAYINIYNDKCDVIAITTINADDVDKVKNTKWKLSNSGYIMNTPKFKGSNIHLSRRILGTNDFVDHINGDKLNNCKNNLRIVTKSQNQMNVNYKGICKTKSNKFYAHIKINQKQINLGTYIDEEEALYARWYAETLLFKEYRYSKEEPNILENRKEQIKDYVNRKVQRL